VDILVIETTLTTNQEPFDKEVQRVKIEGVLSSDRTSFGVEDLFEEQPQSLFRIRADIPTLPGEAPPASLQARLASFAPGGNVIEVRTLTLSRTSGDRFVSQPLLAIPEVIPRADIQFKAPQSLEVLLSRAEGKVRLVVDGLAGLGTREVTVEGRVVELCVVTIQGASPKPERDLTTANRVWAQFGIEVRVLRRSTVNRPKLLNVNSFGKPDPEEVELFELGRDTCTAQIIGYYVKSSTPYTWGLRPLVPLRAGFYVTDEGDQYTFAHELGHVMGLNEHHPDLRNLMAETPVELRPADPRERLLARDQFSRVVFGSFAPTRP
jgi:hypothetical protein